MPSFPLQSVSNWGLQPVVKGRLVPIDSLHDLRSRLPDLQPPVIARGNGRSYGDASLGPTMLSTRPMNRLLAFDETTGRLRCEAGAMLSDLFDTFVPRGWFLPVTPGTRLITVGGAIAADVHGKNHHVDGAFGRHVESLDLLCPDGEVRTCSRTENPEWFRHTVGGMGLTGLILNATFRLKRVETARIREETIRAPNLDTILGLFEESAGWTYSVAWIDCVSSGSKAGRSILMRGEHALADELPPKARSRALDLPDTGIWTVPFTFPGFALNRWTVSAFNALYYRMCPSGRAVRMTDYKSFFHPLDAVLDWNRIYGRRGFLQYQFVLPKAAGRDGLRAILDRIAKSGRGSFLAVLKLFGPADADAGTISFPMEGWTLALDFPFRPGLEKLFLELDAMVKDHGGRLYLAKDARMSRDLFFATYPRAEEFRAFLERHGGGVFGSEQSRRIGLTP